MKLIFNDSTFSFELLRTLSYAPYGGADIGEVLTTGYAIKEGDFESWYNEWLKTAERTLKQAKSFENSGQLLSAGEIYLKASNYYRSAEFFLHGNPDGSRILSTWRKSRESFRKGLSLSQQDVEILEIPYKNTALPAYFYRVDNKPRPTLIIHGGFDSTGEELYFQVVVEALKQGYNCLTFEGPGQGAMIREQHLPFCFEWEKVVEKVVDYLETRSEVIQEKIVLMGISFGGLLAARAASFEHRLAACITDDGLFSFQFSKAFEAHSKGDFDAHFAEQILEELMKKNTNIRWVIENGKFTFGAHSITELFQKTEIYTLKNISEKIQCPTLVCEAEGDMFFKGQPQLLFDSLTSPKTILKFGKQDNAEEHCHMGALTYYNQKIFAWLADTLKP
ncbi:alpha/beta hydrolase family protein [Lactococcus nasutitermitis]|uniref:Alpha/beta hydrolase family protein n=1 Tax=Lactococcus nasutitermitis TaxID=1652957 RepID=A0ABV9JAH2_9LACT|nr:alpha/beta fold hydrolase [Lactococcus nasutitermitis]